MLSGDIKRELDGCKSGLIDQIGYILMEPGSISDQ